MDDKDEIKKPEDKKPEISSADAGEGNQPKAATLVDEANAAAKRMEEANERKADLLRQEEELEAKRALGGGSEAGQAPVKKEETPKEYRARIEKEIQEGKHDD
jgi:hypothetical protein